MAKKIIIGNWKMNPLSLKEAEKLFSSIAKSVSRIQKTEVVICPPFIYLNQLSKIKASLSAGLTPILCVGEDVRDQSHSYFNLVKTQVNECLNGISKDSLTK